MEEKIQEVFNSANTSTIAKNKSLLRQDNSVDRAIWDYAQQNGILVPIQPINERNNFYQAGTIALEIIIKDEQPYVQSKMKNQDVTLKEYLQPFSKSIMSKIVFIMMEKQCNYEAAVDQLYQSFIAKTSLYPQADSKPDQNSVSNGSDSFMPDPSSSILPGKMTPSGGLNQSSLEQANLSSLTGFTQHSPAQQKLAEHPTPQFTDQNFSHLSNVEKQMQQDQPKNQSSAKVIGQANQKAIQESQNKSTNLANQPNLTQNQPGLNINQQANPGNQLGQQNQAQVLRGTAFNPLGQSGMMFNTFANQMAQSSYINNQNQQQQLQQPPQQPYQNQAMRLGQITNQLQSQYLHNQTSNIGGGNPTNMQQQTFNQGNFGGFQHVGSNPMGASFVANQGLMQSQYLQNNQSNKPVKQATDSQTPHAFGNQNMKTVNSFGQNQSSESSNILPGKTKTPDQIDQLKGFTRQNQSSLAEQPDTSIVNKSTGINKNNIQPVKQASSTSNSNNQQNKTKANNQKHVDSGHTSKTTNKIAEQKLPANNNNKGNVKGQDIWSQANKNNTKSEPPAQKKEQPIKAEPTSKEHKADLFIALNDRMQKSKGQDQLVSHYFTFTHVTDDTQVNLLHCYDWKWSMSLSLQEDLTHTCKMHRVPDSKVWYCHYKVEKDKKHEYKFEVKLTNNSQFTETTKITRNFDDIQRSNYCMFDTPNRVGNKSNYSANMFLRFSLFYGRRCHQIPIEFYQSMVKFYDHCVRNYYNKSQNLIVTKKLAQDYEFSDICKLILAGEVKEQNFASQQELDYQIDTDKLKDDHLDQLTEQKLNSLRKGLNICVKEVNAHKFLHRNLNGHIRNHIVLRINQNSLKFRIIENLSIDQVKQVCLDQLQPNQKDLFFEQVTKTRDVFQTMVLERVINPTKHKLNQILLQNLRLQSNFDDMAGCKQLRDIILSQNQDDNDFKFDFVVERNGCRIMLNGITQRELEKFLDFFLKDGVVQRIRQNNAKFFEFTNNFKQIANCLNESPSVNLQNIMKIFQVLDSMDINQYEGDYKLELKKIIQRVQRNNDADLKKNILHQKFSVKSTFIKKYLIEEVFASWIYGKDPQQQVEIIQSISKSGFCLKCLSKEQQAIFFAEYFPKVINNAQNHPGIDLTLINQDWFIKMLELVIKFESINYIDNIGDFIGLIQNLGQKIQDQSIDIKTFRQVTILDSNQFQRILQMLQLNRQDINIQGFIQQVTDNDREIQGTKELKKIFEQFGLKELAGICESKLRNIEHEDITLGQYLNTDFKLTEQIDQIILFYLSDVKWARQITVRTIESTKVNIGTYEQIGHFIHEQVIAKHVAHLKLVSKYNIGIIPQVNQATPGGPPNNEIQQNQSEIYNRDIQIYWTEACGLLSEIDSYTQDQLQEIYTEQCQSLIQLGLLTNINLDVAPKFFELLSKTNRILIYEETVKRLTRIKTKLSTPDYMAEQITLIFSVEIQIEDFKQQYNLLDQPFRDCFSVIEEMIKIVNRNFSFTKLQNIRKYTTEFLRLEEMIDYQRELEDTNINLEDLNDIIDDASQETDVLIQQMIPVRDLIRKLSSMQHGQVVKSIEKEQSFIDCLIVMQKQYETELQNSSLRQQLDNCVSQLVNIRQKVDELLDRGVEIKRVIESYLDFIKVSIQFDLEQNKGNIKFITYNRTNEHKLSVEQLRKLTKRYDLMLKNKAQEHGGQKQNQVRDLNNIVDEVSHLNKLIVELSYRGFNFLESAEGNPDISEEGSLNHMKESIVNMIDAWKQVLQNHKEKIDQLNRQNPSVNFFPPSSFVYLRNLLENIHNREGKEYKKSKQQLIKFAHSINPLVHHFDKLEEILRENKEHALRDNFYDICGFALDRLIEIPNPLFIDDITPGFEIGQDHQIEHSNFFQRDIKCYSISELRLYWISILSIFQNKRQVPQAWQLFFANKYTKLFELEQFVTLAHNMEKHQNLFYMNQDLREPPFFLIANIQEIEVKDQRKLIQFIEGLQSNFAWSTDNLALCFFKDGKQYTQRILQRLQNSGPPTPLSEFNMNDVYSQNLEPEQLDKIIKMGQIANGALLNNTHLFISELSGLGKTYSIRKKALNDDPFQKIIEIPILSESDILNLVNLMQSKLEQVDSSHQKYCLHLNVYSRSNIDENRKIDLHVMLLQILLMRKLHVFGNKYVWINPDIQIYIEIQNSFLNTFQHSLKYLQDRFIVEQNTLVLEIQDTSLGDGIVFRGAPLDDNFEIFNLQSSNLTRLDCIIAFKYLQKFVQNEPGFKAFRVNSHDINEDDWSFQRQAVELFKQMFAVPMLRASKTLPSQSDDQVEEQQVVNANHFSFHQIQSILKFFVGLCKDFHKFSSDFGRLDPDLITMDLAQGGLDDRSRAFIENQLQMRAIIFKGIVDYSLILSCQLLANSHYQNQHFREERQLNEQLQLEILEWRSHTVQVWNDFSIIQNRQGQQMANFFLTLDAHGIPLPIYQHPDDINQKYQQVYNLIQQNVRDPAQRVNMLDWDDPKVDLVQQVLIRMCTSDEGRKKDLIIENLLTNCGDIAITKTISQKLVYLYLKLKLGINTIIMGETGVGKTCLVRYLSQMIQSCVFILDIHTGRTQTEIIDWVKQIKNLSKLSFKDLNRKFRDLLSGSQTGENNQANLDPLEQELKLEDIEQSYHLDSTQSELAHSIFNLINIYKRAGQKELSSQLTELIRNDQQPQNQRINQLKNQLKYKDQQTQNQQKELFIQKQTEYKNIIIEKLRAHFPLLFELVTDLEGWTADENQIKNGYIGSELEMLHHIINRDELLRNIQQAVDQVAQDHLKQTKFILFLDEINTNSNIEGVLKELLIDNKLEGKALPQNFVILAAANPYIFKTRREEESADLLKVKMEFDKDATKKKLVYHVFPMAEAQNSFIWNFGQLNKEDELQIIKKMVANQNYTQLTNHQQIIDHNFLKLVTQIIFECQQFARKNQSNRSVSLRDVRRFLTVYSKLLEGMWQLNPCEALLLQVFYSYVARYNSLDQRQGMCKYLDQKISYWVQLADGHPMKLTLNQEQVIYFEGKIADLITQQTRMFEELLAEQEFKTIALTITLKENLFILLLSLICGVPNILVGPPGSSKTLCSRMLQHAMRGPDSKIQFFKDLEKRLYYKTYQCSILSTSQSIERTFKEAKKLKRKFKDTHIVAIIFDEIGLAEQSPHQPLKVLHKELQDQTNATMIALSNWQLDASKMNRANFLNRHKLTKDELYMAAIQIRDRIQTTHQLPEDIIGALADSTFEYLEKFNARQQQGQKYSFFHGTRDFYNCITQICQKTLIGNNVVADSQTIGEIIMYSVMRNFGGKPDQQATLAYFKQCFSKMRPEVRTDEDVRELFEKYKHMFNPSKLIKDNISDGKCRNIMIIVNRFEQAIEYAEGLCQGKQFKTFQGSDFENEFGEQNGFQTLSDIVTCMEQGVIVILYGLEELYQSLYDLFNMNYVSMAQHNYCRIAIGADSIRGKVHPDFKVILIADKDKVDDNTQYYDPPLLNRFEKQMLDSNELLQADAYSIQAPIRQNIDQHLNLERSRIQVRMFENFQGQNEPDDEDHDQIIEQPVDRNDLPRNRYAFEYQDVFPLLNQANIQDFEYSIDRIFQQLRLNNGFSQNEYLQQMLTQLSKFSSFSSQVRFKLIGKISNDEFLQYKNSCIHFDINELLSQVCPQLQMIDKIPLTQQMAAVNCNLVICYTKWYQAQLNQNFRRYVFEEQIDGFATITNLLESFDKFLNKDDAYVYLLSINPQISKKKLVLAKKRITEKIQQFKQAQENRRQDGQMEDQMQKHVVLVIEIGSQQSNNINLMLFDLYWTQIYMDSTLLEYQQVQVQNALQTISKVDVYCQPLHSFLLDKFVEQGNPIQIVSSTVLDLIFRNIGEVVFSKIKLPYQNYSNKLDHDDPDQIEEQIIDNNHQQERTQKHKLELHKKQFMQLFEDAAFLIPLRKFIAERMIFKVQEDIDSIKDRLYQQGFHILNESQPEWYEILAFDQANLRKFNNLISMLQDFISKHALDTTAQLFWMLEKCSIIEFLLLLKEHRIDQNNQQVTRSLVDRFQLEQEKMVDKLDSDHKIRVLRNRQKMMIARMRRQEYQEEQVVYEVVSQSRLPFFDTCLNIYENYIQLINDQIQSKMCLADRIQSRNKFSQRQATRELEQEIQRLNNLRDGILQPDDPVNQPPNLQFGVDLPIQHFAQLFSEWRNSEEDLQDINSIYDQVIVDKKIYLEELKKLERYQFLNNKVLYRILEFLLESNQAAEMIQTYGLVTVIHIVILICEPFCKKMLPLFNIVEPYLAKVPNSLDNILQETQQHLIGGIQILEVIFQDVADRSELLNPYKHNKIDYLLIFFIEMGSNLMKMLISDNRNLDEMVNWQFDLKSCIKIIQRYTSGTKYLIDYKFKQRIKRFEFVLKLSHCFPKPSKYHNNQIKFKSVVATHFVDQFGQLKQFQIENFNQIKQDLQDLLQDQKMKHLVAMMLLEVSFHDDSFINRNQKGLFMNTMLEPAVQVIQNFFWTNDQTDVSVLEVDFQSINHKIQNIMKLLIEIPMDELRRQRPKFLNFDMEAIFGNPSRLLINQFANILNQFQFELDDQLGMLIYQLLVSQNNMLPQNTDEYFQNNNNQNLQNIINQSYGYGSRDYDQQTGGTFGKIMQSVIVKHAITTQARRIYLREKIYLGRSIQESEQELNKVTDSTLQGFIEQKFDQMLRVQPIQQDPNQIGQQNQNNSNQNPILASMLIAKLKQTHNLSSNAQLTRAADYFRPFFEFKDFFKQPGGLKWHRLLSDRLLDEIKDILQFERPEDVPNQNKTRLKQLCSSQENKFTLTCILAESIISKPRAQTLFLGQIIENLQLTIGITEDQLKVIIEIHDYLKQNQQQHHYPEEMIVCTVYVLIMTLVADSDSLLNQLTKQDANIFDVYIPFVGDSDEIIHVMGQVNEFNYVRRWMCKNCQSNNLNPPFHFIINNCCYPSQSQQCPQCRHTARIGDHYSEDLEPPKLQDGSFEPIFMKKGQRKRYNGQVYYRYPSNEMCIDEFLDQRKRINPGIQLEFFSGYLAKLRETEATPLILMGRTIMLMALTFSALVNQSGLTYQADTPQNMQGRLQKLREIIDKIFMKLGRETRDIFEPWNLLTERFSQQESAPIADYLIANCIFKYFKKENQFKSMNCSTDIERIEFERLFCREVLVSDYLVQGKLKEFSQSLIEPQQNQITRNAIVFQKFDELDSRSIKQFQIYVAPISLSNSNLQQFLQQIEESNQEDNYVCFIKELKDIQSQLNQNCQIYFIMQWLQVFYRITFRKLKIQEASRTKIEDFVNQHRLQQEFNLLKIGWNKIRNDLLNDRLQLDEQECVRINLNDIEDPNCKIDIFCITDDKQMPGFGLGLVMKQLRTNQNRFLQQLVENEKFKLLVPACQTKKPLFMDKNNFLRQLVMKQDGQDDYLLSLQRELFSTCIAPCKLLPQTQRQLSKSIFCIKECVEKIIDNYFRGVCFISDITEDQELEDIHLFKYDEPLVNRQLIDYIINKLKQEVFEPAVNQYNYKNPIEGIDLENIETYRAFKKSLHLIMTVIHNIRDPSYGIKPRTQLIQFTQRFNIESNSLEILKRSRVGPQMCLCHIQHLYEILELTEIDHLMKYLSLERPNVDRNNRQLMQQIDQCPHHINPEYHGQLTPLQSRQLDQICSKFEEPQVQLPIVVNGLLRIVLRQQCSYNTQTQKEIDLFTDLLQECISDYKPMFGIQQICQQTYDLFIELKSSVYIEYGCFQYCHIAEIAYQMHQFYLENIQQKQIRRMRDLDQELQDERNREMINVVDDIRSNNGDSDSDEGKQQPFQNQYQDDQYSSDEDDMDLKNLD